MKKKIILSVILVAVIALSIFYYMSKRFTYNEEGTLGNTAGNLYNEGLFCESDGAVYFANPSDGYKIYKMDPDGKNLEKIGNDRASYINVANGYIYYNRFNHETSADKVLHGALYGVFRLKDGDSNPKELHDGIVLNVTLYGNKLYFMGYNEKKQFVFRSVGVDGKDDKIVSDKMYVSASITGGIMYFPEVEGNHNLLRLNLENDAISTVKTGNFYMPVVIGNYVYYIDLDNDRKLTRADLTSSDKIEVLVEDKCINYNIDTTNNKIYYQVENGKEDHRLMKADMDGSNEMTLYEGDCKNISITSKYCYFIVSILDNDTLYRVSTNGIALPEKFL